MKRCIPLSAAALLLASAAGADVKTYTLDGDQSSFLSPIGADFQPGAVSGLARIDESGLAPTLLELDLRVAYTDVTAATILTGIPGSTMQLDSLEVLRPSPGQVGVGSTSTTITWGTLTGWTSSGRIVCTTHLPGPPPPSACDPIYGFEGTGPNLPLAGTEFDTDPWSFTAAGFVFGPTPSIEFSNDGFGTVRQSLTFGGSLVAGVPGLPLAGLGALGAVLLLLGAGLLRRRSG